MATHPNQSNAVLEQSQIDFFHRHGYLVLQNAIPADVLARLNDELEQWVAESAAHTESYGEQRDGRPRMSLEAGHSEESPALRRVASPIELSATYLSFMRDNTGLDETAVKFHQDFSFEAHTNDSLIAVLYFLNDVTLENGPLQVVPGSHKGKIYSLWQDGVFTGAVDDEVESQNAAHALPCIGSAGTACLMHTRLLHGSAPNLSNDPRNLYILTYTAEDSYPLQPNHIPSQYEGALVRGVHTNQVRCSQYDMALPAHPAGASFFEQQAAKE